MKKFDFDSFSPKEIPKVSLGKKKEKEFQKQEKRIAKELNGYTTPASGATSFNKSDVVSKLFRVECKSTEKKSFSLKKEYLEKIKFEAKETGKKPALSFQFNDSKERWMAVEESVFIELLRYYNGGKDERNL